MAYTDTRQILDRIDAEHNTYSPKLKRVARYVLNHADDIGLNSMRRVALDAGVAPNTLLRLVRNLGFEDYQQFRAPFRDRLRREIDRFPDQARWLQSLARCGRHRQLFSQMAEASLSNIESLYAHVDPDAVRQAADLIDGARCVYVYGVGIGSALAHYFWYIAHMGAANFILVPQPSNLPIDDLVAIGPQDVLLTMTFSPYRKEIVELARYAREQGAQIVAISDGRSSPIMRYARHAFITPMHTPQFFSSLIAVTALLETLLAFIVAGAEEQVVAKIERLHRVRQETGVYWSEEE
jgi:DNA-binding MurR/RpiR family transcriptional regulator